jgi:hypothetical protein
LEGQLIEDDHYANWFKCVATNEDDRMHQKLNDNIESRVQLYPIQVIDDLEKEDDRWS